MKLVEMRVTCLSNDGPGGQFQELSCQDFHMKMMTSLEQLFKRVLVWIHLHARFCPETSLEVT